MTNQKFNNKIKEITADFDRYNLNRQNWWINVGSVCFKHAVFGVVRPGEFLAIMGASGAGKTTLLNTLTHRNMAGLTVTGSRCINRTPADVVTIKSLAGYVEQEDLLIATITVREHLQFQASVRMSSYATKETRMRRVQQVIEQLGLCDCADSVVGDPIHGTKGISGGEMKRLAFACEVITDPPLLFCDEPTSGLDSFMAQNVVSVMKSLAEQGKTVICSIHQPSSEVYALFDKVLFLAEGRVSYMGDANNSCPFFKSIGYACPNNCNPCDFIIETLAVTHRMGEQGLDRINKITTAFKKSRNGQAMLKHATQDAEFANRRGSVSFSGHNQRAGWWRQFQALFRRSLTAYLREPVLLKVRTFQTVAISLLFGIVFMGQQMTEEGVININGALFLFLTNMTFQTVFSVINVFSAEMPIFLREHKAGLYRTDTYFLAKTLAELPLFIVLPSLFVSICYYMIGLNCSVAAFVTCIAIVVLVTNTVCSFGYMTSCICGDISIALVAAAPAILPFLLFGGFFLDRSDVPWWLSWLEQLSWFNHANQALSINQWLSVDHVECSTLAASANALTACPTNGAGVLRQMDISPTNFGRCIGSLAALMVFYRLAALIALTVRAKCR